MLAKFLSLALLASSTLASSHIVARAVDTRSIATAVKGASAQAKAIRAQVERIAKYATPTNATEVQAVLKPLLERLPTVVGHLKDDLRAAKANKRHIGARQVNNAAIAADVAALIVDLALTIATVEQLVSDIPVLSALLTPILNALNPLLAAVLVLLDQLLTGVLVIVANLLQNLLGPNGLINLVPLLSGLGNVLGQLISSLLSGI